MLARNIYMELCVHKFCVTLQDSCPDIKTLVTCDAFRESGLELDQPDIKHEYSRDSISSLPN